LIHDKRGRSVAPAILTGYLMLTYNFQDMMQAFELVVPRGDFQISDHLIGELVLLYDAKRTLQLGFPALDPKDVIVEEDDYNDDKIDSDKKAILALMKEGKVAEIFDNNDEHFSAIAIRRAAWEFDDITFAATPKGVKAFCIALEKFASLVTLDVFLAFRSGMHFRVSSDKSRREYGRHLAEECFEMGNEAQFDLVLKCVRFWSVESTFYTFFLEASKKRMLQADAFGELDPFESILAQKLTAFDEQFGALFSEMICDFERSKRPFGKNGSLLLLNSNFFAQPKVTCNVPESLARKYELPADLKDEKQVIETQMHLGSVEISFNKCVISMPPDVFCVLNCFDGADEDLKLTRDEMFGICAADRLDLILETLVKTVPRSGAALLIQSEDGSYRLNVNFSSKLKRLKIKV